MNQRIAPKQWREQFPDTEVAHILAAVLRSSTSLKKTHICEHENNLTIRLAKSLLKDPIMQTRPVHLGLETWEIGVENAILLGRLDLRYLFSTGILHPWPCFALEAKRLHVTFPTVGWRSLIAEYVTSNTKKPVEEEQGLMCFVSGRYSRGLLTGAMVGYVYDGQVDTAKQATEVAISQHAVKLRLAKTHSTQVSTLIPGESRIVESLHELDHGRFRIYHLPVSV